MTKAKSKSPVKNPRVYIGQPQIFEQDPPLVVQSAKAECDINTIMQRYQRDGLVDHVNKFHGDYGDFTNVPQDFHEAMQQVQEANEMFLTLPSSVRERFGNDPGAFLEAVDGASADELRELGLLPPDGGPPAGEVVGQLPEQAVPSDNGESAPAE